MGVFPDWLISDSVPITPFAPGQERPGVISYGLSSYGYDARVGYQFNIFSNAHCGVVDPKAFDPKSFVEVDISPGPHVWMPSFPKANPVDRSWVCDRCHTDGGKESSPENEFARCPKSGQPDHVLIPPNSFALAETVETFTIPRDVLAVCVGKSTYARCGIIVNVTPLEPEWHGTVTVEISNTTPLPAKIYAGEGIMQILFLQSAGVTESILWTLVQTIALTAGPMAAQLIKEMYFQLARPRGPLVVPIRLHPRGPCVRSYADKQGRYMGQTGITLPKVD